MTSYPIDRYNQGDLSAAEARELAQSSLDSPELFDELTDSALAKAALYSRPRPARHRTWIVIAGLAAAALFICVMVMRPWRTPDPALKPTLAIAGSQVQPVLLAGGLHPADQDLRLFRSPQTGSRAPQIEGTIVSIEDGLATLDLGSLDGLAEGSELQVLRDAPSSEARGHLQVTTVFRERARGRVLDGQTLRAGSRVRVDDAAHLDALLDQVDALYNHGDADAAYQTAERASRWAQSSSVPPVRQSGLWNELAVLRMLRGDYHDAEALLSRSAAVLPKSGTEYARNMNNLGVVYELHGDRRTAESRYADALRVLVGVPDMGEQERHAVEANLSRVRGLH